MSRAGRVTQIVFGAVRCSKRTRYMTLKANCTACDAIDAEQEVQHRTQEWRKPGEGNPSCSGAHIPFVL
jgi:hypothetical protein